MNRKSGQLIALLVVVVLVVIVIAYQFFQRDELKSSVLDPYGYASSDDDDELDDNPADESSIVNGLPQKKYYVAFAEKVVLDGLIMPIQVPSLATPVRWTPDDDNPVRVDVDDPSSARSFFIAPSYDVELIILLETNLGGVRRPVANFLIVVMSPIAIKADANNDRKYDISDLSNLLQNWDSFGDEATRVLSVILSRYQ